MGKAGEAASGPGQTFPPVNVKPLEELTCDTFYCIWCPAYRPFFVNGLINFKDHLIEVHSTTRCRRCHCKFGVCGTMKSNRDPYVCMTCCVENYEVHEHDQNDSSGMNAYYDHYQSNLGQYQWSTGSMGLYGGYFPPASMTTMNINPIYKPLSDLIEDGEYEAAGDGDENEAADDDLVAVNAEIADQQQGSNTGQEAEDEPSILQADKLFTFHGPAAADGRHVDSENLVDDSSDDEKDNFNLLTALFDGEEEVDEQQGAVLPEPTCYEEQPWDDETRQADTTAANEADTGMFDTSEARLTDELAQSTQTWTYAGNRKVGVLGSDHYQQEEPYYGGYGDGTYVDSEGPYVDSEGRPGTPPDVNRFSYGNFDPVTGSWDPATGQFDRNDFSTYGISPADRKEEKKDVLSRLEWFIDGLIDKLDAMKYPGISSLEVA